MSKALVIAVCLIGFGVMSNWYLVQVQPLEAPNPRLRQGFGGQAYQSLYEELLYPSVKITASGSTGSGVVIYSNVTALQCSRGGTLKQCSYETYVLTAAHVVGDESEVTVEFYHQDSAKPPVGTKTQSHSCKSRNLGSWIPAYAGMTVEKSFPAFVVITDTVKDLALLRVVPPNPHNLRFHVAKLAPRNYAPRIFTPIWVVGCSLGLPPRPTAGQITAVSSPSPFSSPSRGEDRERVNHWQINAPIWPGNSGGGIFLKDTHELIGIAVLVKVYHGQLVSTMGSIVPLQDIYEFLTRAGERLAVNGKRFALIDTRTPNISNPTPQTTRGSD